MKGDGYHSGDDLTGVGDNAILGSVHIKGNHAGNVLDQSNLLKTLDTGGTHGTIMASRRDNNLSLNDVRVHARLSIVMQGNQGPVGDDTGNTTILDNEILSGESVEELDVGAHEELGEDGGGEEGGVLDDDVVLIAVLEWDADLGQEVVAGLADNHG